MKAKTTMPTTTTTTTTTAASETRKSWVPRLRLENPDLHFLMFESCQRNIPSSEAWWEAAILTPTLARALAQGKLVSDEL